MVRDEVVFALISNAFSVFPFMAVYYDQQVLVIASGVSDILAFSAYSPPCFRHESNRVITAPSLQSLSAYF